MLFSERLSSLYPYLASCSQLKAQLLHALNATLIFPLNTVYFWVQCNQKSLMTDNRASIVEASECTTAMKVQHRGSVLTSSWPEQMCSVTFKHCFRKKSPF